MITEKIEVITVECCNSCINAEYTVDSVVKYGHITLKHYCKFLNSSINIDNYCKYYKEG